MARVASLATLPPAHRAFFDRITAFIPADRILLGPFHNLALGDDASFYRLVPKIVVKATTEDEVARLLRAASAERCARTVIVPRGIHCCGFAGARGFSARNSMPRPWPTCGRACRPPPPPATATAAPARSACPSTAACPTSPSSLWWTGLRNNVMRQDNEQRLSRIRTPKEVVS